MSGPVVVSAMREPVTLTRASQITGWSLSALRELVKERKLQPRACLVAGRRPQLFDLWEVEAAIAGRRRYRRVATRPTSHFP